MRLERSARQYAKALLDTAREKGEVDDVRRDLLELKDLLRQSRELRSFFEAFYILDRVKRLALLNEMFKGRLSDATDRFLIWLDERKALHSLSAVCDAFEKLYSQSIGQVTVRVSTAVDFAEDQKGLLFNRLRERFGPHGEPEVARNPELLGGFKIQVNDTVYDYSVKGKLDSLRRSLAHA
ncbi:MAG: ATP synthase F1 subunit delta [Lentisphaerota bacterium]